MRDRAEIVIIGGGVMGLALAWQLARRGVRDIVVLEQGYLCFGSSGRNGGGVRQQWSTEDHIRLARRSVSLYRRLASETGINIWFRQGGYLFLCRSKEQAQWMEENVELQNRLGVPTRLLDPAQAAKLVPGLNTDGVELCSYNSTDGVLFPWPVVWGLARAATELGVEINTFCRVTAIDVRDGRIVKVVTDKGSIATPRVVNAAGGWSASVARLAGVELPNKPYRHEILVTEPLKPFLKPMVCDLSDGTYFSQTMRGEICGGISDPLEPPSMNTSSSLRFLGRMARALCRLIPRLAGVKVLRQWAGYYDETPDGNPVLGRTPGVEGFIQLNGFGGHGFMLAPAVAEAMADWMLRRKEDPIFERYTLERFEKGQLQGEKMVIG